MLSAAIADGVVLTSAWVLGALAGSGTVIAVLFKLLIASKDRQIDRLNEEINGVREDFSLFVEQTKKDELRREKEDEHVKLLIDEAIRVRAKTGGNRPHN